MILHVPFHWMAPSATSCAEGFADTVLEVDHAPRNAGELVALKERIGAQHHLDPQLITLFAWSVMSE